MHGALHDVVGFPNPTSIVRSSASGGPSGPDAVNALSHALVVDGLARTAALEEFCNLMGRRGARCWPCGEGRTTLWRSGAQAERLVHQFLLSPLDRRHGTAPLSLRRGVGRCRSPGSTGVPVEVAALLPSPDVRVDACAQVRLAILVRLDVLPGKLVAPTARASSHHHASCCRSLRTVRSLHGDFSLESVQADALSGVGRRSIEHVQKEETGMKGREGGGKGRTE